MLVDRPRNAASAEKTFGELFQALVAVLSRMLEEASDVRVQLRLAPAIPRGFFGIARGTVARGFEQRRRGRRIEFGVVARWKREAATGAVAGVLVDERPRHPGCSSRTSYNLPGLDDANPRPILDRGSQ